MQHTALTDAIGRNDPHAFLGLHEGKKGKVLRFFKPGAGRLHIELHGKIVECGPLPGSNGLFELPVPQTTSPSDYRIYHQNGLLAHDPYAFQPTFGELDAHLLSRGVHYELHRILGGRLATHQDIAGAKFAVWAPSAARISVVGDFNHWDGRIHPMRSLGGCGVFELFIPGLKEGDLYKFEIQTASGEIFLKADPYSHFFEERPKTASILFDNSKHHWEDQNWKARSFRNSPMNIYEMHLGSWKQVQPLNYRTLAPALSSYCKEMGYTHVELMAICEHPLDESWGYQVSGFFAPTSRYGTPSDFQYFVDHLHQQGIGVLLDWVPAHFPKDDWALAHFDGTCLYEHMDPRQGYHPHWNTAIFNFGRPEVSNFLIASALFWLEEMHIDGLRVDAVASMLYLDYGRENSEWIPNQFGGKENLEAIEFMKHLNSIVHERNPHALMIAEESTSFASLTHPLDWGGLGFDMKWNMGWMNDTLRYFMRDPVHRSYHQNDLTFGLLYAFSEHFILVLSHDEVANGKGSLISKMPGDAWQKFANLRLLYSFMMTQPGKKLLFMGGEFGQGHEWSCKEAIHWFLLDAAPHAQLHCFTRDLNHFYLENRALWEHDFDSRGFEWIDYADHRNCVLSYLRKGEGSYLACVHNFTPQFYPDYFVRLPTVTSVKEVFNSDREEYGGSGKINSKIKLVHHEDRSVGFVLQLAPLATMIFEVKF